MKVKELIEHLKKYNDLEDEIAYDLWTIEDVSDKCDEMGIEMSKFHMKRVLQYVERFKDAEYGINWQIIENAIDQIHNGQW